MSYMNLAATPQVRGRLAKDIQRAQEDLIKEQGIWYIPNDVDMTKGHAMILGPENTPYEGCLLLFSVAFPSDYPFSPPKVLFLTSDSRTRFHPNLYVDGKVCLSILGTFTGPSWSASQSLSSVLLSILALLDDNPLSHEPAFSNGTLSDIRHKCYADAVEHNIVLLMTQTINHFEQNTENKSFLWYPFREIIVQQLPKIKKLLAKKILSKAQNPEEKWLTLVYGMSISSCWKKMAETVGWVKGEATA